MKAGWEDESLSEDAYSRGQQSREIGTHDEKGRFKKGHKRLAPYSRQKLTRVAFLQLADDKLIEAIPKVVEMVIQKALKGNLHAAKLIFDRLIPAQRPSTHRASMGGIQIVVQGGAAAEVKKVFDVEVNNNEEEII